MPLYIPAKRMQERLSWDRFSVPGPSPHIHPPPLTQIPMPRHAVGEGGCWGINDQYRIYEKCGRHRVFGGGV